MSTQLSTQPRRSWGLLRPERVEVELPDEDEKFWLIRELRRRNFPPPGEPEANTIILISGDLRTGKSTTAAKLIIGAGDTTYVPSMKFHPANGGHSADLWRCHVSTSPGPLIEAVNHELHRYKENLPPEYLLPGSYWHLDEPTEIKSTEWWTQVAKDVGDTVMENAFLRFNVVICTPLRGRVLSMLRELANLWIRVYPRMGQAMVHSFKSRINYGSATRPEIRIPQGVCPIFDDTDPTRHRVLREWYDSYMPIKVWNAEGHAQERVARLGENRRRIARKGFETSEGVKKRTYVA